MHTTNLFTKALAVVGVVLAWFPIAATVLTSAGSTIGQRAFQLDFLMPAELFPAALIGGALLLWAALRARSHVRLIAWGLGLVVALPVVGQVFASVTGLASGETEPEGWPVVLVAGALAGYTLALVGMGVAGALLVYDVFKRGDKGVEVRRLSQPFFLIR